VKRLFNVIVLALAANFLILAGGVGYLWKTERLDRDKVHSIREILFPPNEEAGPAARPATQPATQPVLNLDAVLVAHANMPAAEQVQLLQRTFDSRMAQLDRRQRELEALHDLVKNGEARLAKDRADFEQELLALRKREQEADQLAKDKGFQDSLELYGTMKPKQVKDVFAGLPDDVVVRYLRAMDPGQAGKIIKEFKTPAEVQRVKGLMEQVRSAAESAGASAR
jgi:flagellar motility protein MotE (MotC chaperone)